MNIEELFSSENVSSFCRAICQMVEMKCPDSQVHKYVNILQQGCCGVSENKFSKFYGVVLSPAECLDTLLKVRGLSSKLETDPDQCLRVLLAILNVSTITKKTGDFLAKILPRFLRRQPTKNTEELIKKIWNHEDFPRMPLHVVECIIEIEPSLLEIFLIDMVRNVCDKKETEMWSSAKYKHWILWSSQSSLLFSAITSILNEILCFFGSKSLILNLIQDFICCIKNCCDLFHWDMVSLYPSEYHSLAVIFQLDPFITPSNIRGPSVEYIINKFKNCVTSNPNAILALLTHYPKWIPFLAVNNVFEQK